MKKIADEIIYLLLLRGEGKSICPSEVARSLFPNSWRQKMESVRKVAVKLAKDDMILITQSGKKVDPDHFKGAIRLRLK